MFPVCVCARVLTTLKLPAARSFHVTVPGLESAGYCRLLRFDSALRNMCVCVCFYLFIRFVGFPLIFDAHYS